MGFLSILFGFVLASQTTVQPSVWTEVQNKNQSDIVVYFTPVEDFKEARSILDRDSRIHRVVDVLKTTVHSMQAPAIQYLQSQGLDHKVYYSGNLIVVKNARMTDVQSLLGMENVRHVGLNISSTLNEVEDAREISEPEVKRSIGSHLKLINVPKVWTDLKVRGKGIVVAAHDTGFFGEHDLIKKQYRGWNGQTANHNYNWHDGIVDSQCVADGVSPCDDKGHGTHVMGTLVGDDGRGVQTGPAPDARWMGCRNMKVGVGTVESYMECFDFFLAPFPIGGNFKENGDPKKAPHIVNNSWSCPKKEGCMGTEFVNVIKAYKEAGIMLVAAASNSGPGCGTVSSQPGTYSEDVFVVGAWNTFINEVAFFSSKGPSTLTNKVVPHVVARGDIKSELAQRVKVP